MLISNNKQETASYRKCHHFYDEKDNNNIICQKWQLILTVGKNVYNQFLETTLRLVEHYFDLFGTMSIPFSGSFTRSAGIVSARAKEIKSLNLKACKKITVTFDPFHAKSAPTR